MKILHIVPSLAIRHGGVSTSVRDLCLGLAQLGLEVEIWSTRRGYEPEADEPADRQLNASGVTIRYFPVETWGGLGQRYALSLDLGRALSSSVPEYDLLHIHTLWLYPTQTAALACHRFQKPYVLSPTGMLDPYSLKIRGLLKRLYVYIIERRTMAGAACIHFTSFLEQREACTFGVHRPNEVIPLSIDLASIPPVSSGTFRSKHPEVGSRKILLFLGRLHPKKRLDLLAQAFLALLNRRDDLHLVIAGPDDGAASPVRRLLERGRALSRVTFTGQLSGVDKWAAYRDSSLFLLPSEDENFGMTVLEAMACDVPVLLSARVGIADWAVRAEAGRVVPLEPDAWAGAADQLLGDPAQAEAMGRAGRRLAETEFSRTAVALRMKELYDCIS